MCKSSFKFLEMKVKKLMNPEMKENFSKQRKREGGRRMIIKGASGSVKIESLAGGRTGRQAGTFRREDMDWKTDKPNSRHTDRHTNRHIQTHTDTDRQIHTDIYRHI